MKSRGALAKLVMEKLGGMRASCLPSTIRRVILLGVPSLALLGLVGIVSWRWLRRETTSRSANSRPSPAARSRCDQASSPDASKRPPCSEHSPTSEDSGVVDTGSQGCSSGKNSEEEDLPNQPEEGTTFRIPPGLKNQPRRSSNLPMESETPLKPPAVPLIENENDSYSDTSSTQESKNLPVASKINRIRIMVHIPRGVVGRFIGKQGRNIKALMLDSNGAHVFVNQKNVPSDAQSVLCTIQGTPEQVEEAVKIIEAKYPEIDIPVTSLLGSGSSPKQLLSSFLCPIFSASDSSDDPWGVVLLPAVIPPKSFSATASFIEGITDLWLVTWEKCMEVDRMHSSMSYVYKRLYPDGQGTQAQLEEENDQSLLGKFCAVRVSNIHWLRGRVARFGDCSDSYEVQLVDYGSMVLVPSSSVKPLR